MQEPARQSQGEPESSHRTTTHAVRRMHERSISEAAVRATLEHGRIVHVRGAAVHAIGHKEISRLGRRGIDVSHCEGIQIVCAPDGTILTAYRNRNFRGLRPRRRRTVARTARS